MLGKKFSNTDMNNFDLVMFLDTDRFPVSKEWLRCHLEFHNKHSQFAIYNGRFVEQDYEPLSPFRDVNYLIQCNCSIKLKYLKEVGGYDRSLIRGEDWDMAVKLFRIGARSFVSSKVAITVAKPDTTKSFLKKVI